MRRAEIMARAFITVGGLGVIAAVATICVFLFAVAAPLFSDATLTPRSAFPSAAADPPAHFEADEYGAIGWILRKSGALEVVNLRDGGVTERVDLFASGAKPTAIAVAARDGKAVFGFADGSIRFCVIAAKNRLIDADVAPPELASLATGAVVRFGQGTAERLASGDLRAQEIEVALDEPVRGASSSAVALIDRIASRGRNIMAVLRTDGSLALEELHETTNLLTGDVARTVEEAKIPFSPPPDVGPPAHLKVSDLGDNVYLAWNDGRTMRFDARKYEAVRLAESLDLIAAPGAKMTTFSFLIGGSTLIVGDSVGGLSGWFRTKPKEAGTCDGALLAEAHRLPRRAAAVTAVAPSRRNRMFAAGYSDGVVRVIQMTTERVLAEARTDGGEPVTHVRISPKNDAVFALTPTKLVKFSLHAPFGDVSLAGILRPVWYEGYEKPEHVWQSTSGGDDFEPKFGLMPLVFGSLKATFYALLFAVPLALLAAVYTSEFLSPGLRARIKPAVEMMASLPSVVLGFLAALILAPLAESVVPAILAAGLTIPLAFLAGAYIWQAAPPRTTLRLGSGGKFGLLACALPFGIAAAAVVGPALERALFGGDLKAWLDGRTGGPFGGWAMLLFGPAALAVVAIFARFINPRLRAAAATWSRGRAAAVDTARFLVGFLLAAGIAAATAALLGALGLDPRGAVVGSYVQRNALVVGFVMGFAVIPVIYTLAEDALASVPESLRSASLGAGATPWQTATRVVIPTAMSGLFSAVMVGLGRAVGETMIVLMAAGNTPVLDWNVFNGFRTLSANIAVELPEAVQGEVHYRMLFLAAAVLFGVTFALNTAAEVVRRRFRARAFQL